MTQQQSILIIDDDLDVGEFVAAAAEGLGIPCVSTSIPTEFLASLTSEITLVFLDLVMPHFDGIELLRLLSHQPHKPNIVIMSGIGKRIIETAHRLGESLGLNIVAELAKPFRLAEIEEILKAQMDQEELPAAGEKVHLHISDDEFLRAIGQNELVLHYQPQVRISDNKLVSVEALVRWKQPDRGMIFPDDFIPLAERLGLIDELGWVVATLAFAEYADLQYPGEETIGLSINVSVQSLRNLDFPDRLVKLMHVYAIPTEKLILEITESGLINELSSALDVLTRLRMKGIKLSIDDFGTGYSMMQQLRVVPATELKIDRSFVQNMYASASDRVIVLKTIEIGHELGMCVIAEGVETTAQLDFLREHGCDLAQGYLFSRPLSSKALKHWIRNHRETYG